MKFYPRTSLTIVSAQAALLGAGVGESKLQFPSGRAEFADLHGSANEILMLVVDLFINIFVYGQSPLVLARDYVQALGAGRYLRLVKNQIDGGEQHHGRSARRPGFSVLGLFLVAENGDVADADLIAILETTRGCDRIRFGISQRKDSSDGKQN